jgi:hypothetical protein
MMLHNHHHCREKKCDVPWAPVRLPTSKIALILCCPTTQQHLRENSKQQIMAREIQTLVFSGSTFASGLLRSVSHHCCFMLLLPQSERIYLFAICVDNVSTLRTVEEILLKTSIYKLLPPSLEAPAVASPNLCSLENNKSFNPKSFSRTLVFKQAYRNLFSLNLTKPSFNRCSTGASVSVISTCE